MKVTTEADQIAGHDGTRRSVVRIDGGEIDSDEPGDAHLDVEGWLVTHEIRVDTPDVVTLPRGGVSVADGPDRLPPEASRSVEGGATLVCESPVACLVRVDGGASVTVDSRGRATVRPEGDVVVGWTHRPDPAVTEISLPSRDTAGVATALRAATAVALPSTQTPDRTWPNSRSAAPSITTTPHRGTHPSEVERVDTGVELTVPDDLAAVAATATLAGYLGAEVSVGEEATLHAAGESWRLGSEPETVDSRSSSFLRRVFYLDCHVRSAGPHGTRLAGHAAALAAVDGDAETLYELPLAERVARYLAADDRVDDELPRWPETLHVEPSVERLTGVTPQLCRLADVRLPRCERLELPEMIDYEPREAAVRGAADTDPKARVVPDSAGEAAITGWAAAGRPTAAFAASEPVTRQPREDDGPLRATVVQCGGESAAETAARWRETIAEQEIDLSVVSRPTVEQLRETLRADHDIVHVAAHDGGAGVECADGTLGLVDLPDSITPTASSSGTSATPRSWQKRQSPPAPSLPSGRRDRCRGPTRAATAPTSPDCCRSAGVPSEPFACSVGAETRSGGSSWATAAHASGSGRPLHRQSSWSARTLRLWSITAALTLRERWYLE